MESIKVDEYKGISIEKLKTFPDMENHVYLKKNGNLIDCIKYNNNVGSSRKAIRKAKEEIDKYGYGEN